MKKEKEWLKNEVFELYPSYDEMYEHPDYITVAKVDLINDFIELIDQLDEPERPVIPKFVADWIDTHNLCGNNPLREYRDLDIDFNEGWTNEKDAAVYHWINKNPYAFIDALRYGYEVEKEKLYYVLDNKKRTLLWKYPNKVKNSGGYELETVKRKEAYTLTEKEIKDYDERFWQFAVPVEEEAE